GDRERLHFLECKWHVVDAATQCVYHGFALDRRLDRQHKLRVEAQSIALEQREELRNHRVELRMYGVLHVLVQHFGHVFAKLTGINVARLFRHAQRKRRHSGGVVLLERKQQVDQVEALGLIQPAHKTEVEIRQRAAVEVQKNVAGMWIAVE